MTEKPTVINLDYAYKGDGTGLVRTQTSTKPWAVITARRKPSRYPTHAQAIHHAHQHMTGKPKKKKER